MLALPIQTQILLIVKTLTWILTQILTWTWIEPEPEPECELNMNLNLNLTINMKLNLNPNLNWGSAQYSTSEKLAYL